MTHTYDVDGPLAMALTHRKGSVVVVADPSFGKNRLSFLPPEGLERVLKAFDLLGLCSGGSLAAATVVKGLAKSPVLGRLAQALDVLPDAPETGLFGGPGLGVWHSRAPTAETLRLHFLACAAKAGVSLRDLKTLGFAAGPAGSFTGLRLGAAFVSGFVQGRQGVLAVGIRTGDPIGGRPARDVAVGFESEEILAATAQMLLGLAVPATWGAVEYSSEPGPVLVLRSKGR
jgi:hypothetical protein